MKKKILVSTIGVFILTCGYLAEAQQPGQTVPRVGVVISTGAPGTSTPWFKAFHASLRNFGYLEGENIIIERRYAEGNLNRMPALVNDLVKEKVDVILATNNKVIQAAKKATTTIPIVILTSVDPVAAGYVGSFARPGGNITGLTTFSRDLSAKRVEFLRQMLPDMSRLAILWDKDGPGPTVAFKEYQEAARAFKLELRSLEVRGPNPDFSSAFQTAKNAQVDALIVVRNPLITRHKKKIFELATKNRLPSMTEEHRHVDAGGLISYGPDAADLYRRAAEYVVEILKGAKPADLPVKLPEKFEIFVNLKTAREIGIVIPQHILVQADKVIR